MIGGVVVEGDRILDSAEGLFSDGVPSGIRAVNCDGHCLAPGLIDMRVQLPGPGAVHKESLESASAAAVAGGVTSIVCLPNTEPVIDEVAAAEFITRSALGTCPVKVHTYGAVTRGTRGLELAEFGLMAEAGVTAFTDGNRAVTNALVMRRALDYAATFGVLLVQHPEEPDLAAEGHMNEGSTATRLGLRGIPAEAEVMMIERDLRLVAMTGARYHAAHISTGAAVDAIRIAKAQGLPVSCDTAPHYFTLDETAVMDYRTFAKVSPPLRTADDRQAIIEGIRDGTIDAIASDHQPQDQDAKRRPFAQARNGIIGLETLLPLALSLHHKSGIGLLDVLACLTSNPAMLLQLKPGRLTPGLPADLVLFDPHHDHKVDVDRMRSKSGNSPFDGFPVRGRVLRTLINGEEVYSFADLPGPTERPVSPERMTG